MGVRDSFGRVAGLVIRSFHVLLLTVLSLLTVGVAGTWLALTLQLRPTVSWKDDRTFSRSSFEASVSRDDNGCDVVVVIDRPWGHLVWFATVDRMGLKYPDFIAFIGYISYPLTAAVPRIDWQWGTFAFSMHDEDMPYSTEFAVRHGESHQRIPFRHCFVSAILPFWFLVLLTGAYPTFAGIRGPVRRWRRRKNGLCVHCGYNLQGNVSGVCSECGRETTKAPRHKAES